MTRTVRCRNNGSALREFAMQRTYRLIGCILVSCLATLGGCSTARDVQVSGEIKSATALQGPITLQFFETSDDTKAVQSVLIDKVGTFDQKVQMAGDQVRIVAFADLDKNGACTDGEPSADATADIKDDTKAGPVVLELASRPCPKSSAGSK